MKALILYRSFYGNTRKVAAAIAQELQAAGHEALVQDVRDRLPDLTQTGAVFIGAPTRMARPGRKALKAVKGLRRAGLTADGLVAVFDTYGPVPETAEELEKNKKWLYPGAAGILLKAAEGRKLKVHPEALRCEVKGAKGPLADGALEQAAAFTRGIVAELGEK